MHERPCIEATSSDPNRTDVCALRRTGSRRLRRSGHSREPTAFHPLRPAAAFACPCACRRGAVVIGVVALAAVGAHLDAFTGWAVVTGDEPEARVWPEVEERLAA